MGSLGYTVHPLDLSYCILKARGLGHCFINVFEIQFSLDLMHMPLEEWTQVPRPPFLHHFKGVPSPKLTIQGSQAKVPRFWFLEFWRGLGRVLGQSGNEGGAKVKYPLLHSTNAVSGSWEQAQKMEPRRVLGLVGLPF